MWQTTGLLLNEIMNIIWQAWIWLFFRSPRARQVSRDFARSRRDDSTWQFGLSPSIDGWMDDMGKERKWSYMNMGQNTELIHIKSWVLPFHALLNSTQHEPNPNRIIISSWKVFVASSPLRSISKTNASWPGLTIRLKRGVDRIGDCFALIISLTKLNPIPMVVGPVS